MPILYLHGVLIRDETGWDGLERILRRYVAPVIAKEPEQVLIERCFWGDFGARFRWNNLSTPDSPIRHAMLDTVSKAKDNQANMVRFSEVSKRLIEQTKPKQRASQPPVRLKDLSPENLSNFCASLIAADSTKWSMKELNLAIMAADEVIYEAATHKLLEKCIKIEEEYSVLQKLVKERYKKMDPQVSPSSMKLLPSMTKTMSINLLEGLERAAHGAGFAVTRAAAEIRVPINMFVTTFIGDVLTYLYGRGDATMPGQIPLIVLESLVRCRENQKERPGEPLIVLSHSMGGQIMYDLVTHFLPRMPEFSDMRIDFWCAAASQVGLFEELKLFLESSDEFSMEYGNQVPFPDKRYLGYWWNVWDHNDFISWSAKGIIDGIDDEFYNTGMFLVDAHGGYLVLPSFFRRFAKKLEHAKAHNWMREDTRDLAQKLR